MPPNDPQEQAPAYTFLGSSPTEEYLDVARIHHREAKQLLERAQEALAEDRQEEARLLTDLAIAWRERAEAFERAARGEGGDPIVAEILNNQQTQRNNDSSSTPTYTAPVEDIPSWVKEIKPHHLGPIARAVAWVGSWITG
jgi:acyl-CoA reductase-like NAD-dependent aldehyde dehydrogenase